MSRAWNIGEIGKITLVSRNTYLVQFEDEGVMWEVLSKGIWNYRSEVVALQKVTKATYLIVERIKEIKVWVQIHNVPQKVLMLGDIELLFRSLGTLLFEVKEIHIQDRRAYKAKDMLQLDNSLRDRVEVQHPEGGVMCLPLVCEKIYRACRFCGEVGHELGDCTSKNRLMRLSKDVEYSDRPEIHDILQPKLGPWITDYVKIPRGRLGEKTGLYQKK
jgi:Domain of unknown function (DUF4283)